MSRTEGRPLGLVALSALVALASGEGRARADVVPPGLVPVNQSIHVDVEGTLPTGKVLIMTGTFGGADVIHTGAVVPFTVGKYELARLILLDSSDLPELNAAVASWRPGRSAYEARKAITDRGAPCSDYLEVQRRVEETSPVKEVRLFYSIKADGVSCASRLLRTELLSESGAVIETQAGSTRWPELEVQPSTPAADVSARRPGDWPVVLPEPPEPGGLPAGTSSCGSCEAGAHGGDRLAALLALLSAVALTRRRAPRTHGREREGMR